MKEPSLEELDQIRKTGFRPNVVCCFIHDKKILLALNKEWQLWQIPQGGIENGEHTADAIKREAIEELGKNFFDQCEKDYELVGVEKIEFVPEKHNVKELKDDEGNNINMIGKVYFYYAIKSNVSEVNIEETQFDECYYLGYDSAIFLADKIYQLGKKRITLSILNNFKERGLIS